jgi:hypothetical protein
MSKLKRSLTLAVALLLALVGIGVAAGPAHASPPYFYYAKGSQAISNTGMYATMTVASPAVTSGDFHSLMELSVQSSDQKQTVEVGWTVDPNLFSGSNPTSAHLFAGTWTNGVFNGYNTGCTDNAANATNLGATLANNAGKHFGIQHGGTPSGWWIYYDDVNVCYFADTIWTSPTFTAANFDQGFMEVAANVSATCTDGGNGTAAGTGAAFIGSVQYVGQPTSAVSLTLGATNSAYYSTSSLSARSFYAGGPGAC